MQNEPTRVCAYVRVSTKDKEQLSSFENQITFFRREFGNTEHNKQWELVHLYADCGKSGTSLHRPDFDRMIYDAGIDRTVIDGDLFRIRCAPAFNRILVKNTSRFARNVSSDMLIKTLTKNNVFIDFVDTHLSTERPADIMTLQVLQVLDEHESRDKSRKVLFGIEEDIRKGNIHSLGTIYGYRYYPKPDNRLEAIPEEAEVIREIYRLYVHENLGAERIAKNLTSRGILTRKGKGWNLNTILGILDNEAYTGIAVRRKYTKGTIFEYHTVQRSANPERFQTDKIEPIVSRELFEKAQSIRRARRTNSGERGKNQLRSPLSNIVFCGECGEPCIVIGTRKTKKNGIVRVYACRNRKETGCRSRNVTDAKIERFLRDNPTNGTVISCLEGCRRQLIAKRKKCEELIHVNSGKELKEIQTELEEVAQKRMRLLELYLDMKYSREELDRLGEPLLVRETVLKEKKRELEASDEDVCKRIVELDHMIDMIEAKEITLRTQGDNITQSGSEKELMEKIERINIFQNGRIEIIPKELRTIDEFMQRIQ